MNLLAPIKKITPNPITLPMPIPPSGSDGNNIYTPIEQGLLGASSLANSAQWGSTVSEMNGTTMDILAQLESEAGSGSQNMPLGPQASYLDTPMTTTTSSGGGGSSAILFVGIAIVGLAGWFWWSHTHKKHEADHE